MLARLSKEGLANGKIITEKGKTHQEKLITVIRRAMSNAMPTIMFKVKKQKTNLNKFN